MVETMYIHRVNKTLTPHKLDTLDLNLLRVLQALLEELNVGRAAARLGRSQPAVSNALARLRRALSDPLFVRTREGIAPTARAQALARPLAAALQGLRAAIEEPARFDPTRAQRSFVLAAS